MAKKANGDGTIYRRKDGRWCASVSLGNGRRKHFLNKDRDVVARQLRAALAEQDRGLPVTNGRDSVEQYLESWLASARPALRERTWERYEQYVRLHVNPTLGRMRLDKLTPQQLQRLYAERLAAGSSSTTVHHLHATIHKALKQAVRWNLVSRNVADFVDPPRISVREMATLSDTQVRTLLDAARGDRLEALYVVAVTTGMRQGELLALRWRDVNLESGRAQIRGSMQATKAGLKIVETKTPGSRRQVALSQAARSALTHHRARQAEERLRVGSAWEDNDLVFCNQVGRPIPASHLTMRSFQPLLIRAGLPRVRFHDLRHTAATLLLGAGTHAKIVSEMLGHSRIGTTMDLYSHVTPTMQQQAADTFDAILAR